MAFEIQAAGPNRCVDETSGQLAAKTRGGRLLLAEDDDEMRRLLGSELRRAGHQVVEAINGIDLLAKAGRCLLGCGGFALDLVITDIRMPGFDGLEVLAALHETAPGLPVIVISAFGSRDVHEEAERLGARAFLDKPFDMVDLRAAVLRVLSRES